METRKCWSLCSCTRIWARWDNRRTNDKTIGLMSEFNETNQCFAWQPDGLALKNKTDWIEATLSYGIENMEKPIHSHKTFIPSTITTRKTKRWKEWDLRHYKQNLHRLYLFSTRIYSTPSKYWNICACETQTFHTI